MGPSWVSRLFAEKHTSVGHLRNVVLQGDNVALQGTEVKKLPLGGFSQHGR